MFLACERCKTRESAVIFSGRELCNDCAADESAALAAGTPGAVKPMDLRLKQALTEAA
jgi:hypothetical protein